MLASYVLVLIATLHAVCRVPGVRALTCNECNESTDVKKCTDTGRDRMTECTSATTCTVATDIRKRKTNNVVRAEPFMSRGCSLPLNQVKDAENLALAKKRGWKTICNLAIGTIDSQQGDRGGLNIEYNVPERRCVCAEDKCNSKHWDEVMVLPVVPRDHNADETAAGTQKLGNNALEKILALTFPDDGSLPDTLPDTDSTPGIQQTSIAVATSSQTINSLVSSTIAETSDEESGGLSAGLLAGAAVGVVIFLGVIGALIYWLKSRKSEEGGSDATGESGASADTEADEDDEVILPEEA